MFVQDYPIKANYSQYNLWGEMWGGYIHPKYLFNYINGLRGNSGGGGGIRTHETLSRLPVFKTGAFNRSATPPDARLIETRWGV
jgi:hypothetical protein